MSSSYNAENIQVLDFPECVRKRPGMYIGGVSGTNPQGLYRICREIIDNSLDEFLAGYNKKVIILYNTKNDLVSIIDQGRGIPTGKKKDGNYALTEAVSKLHAGGKFERGAYQVASGLHGVGAKATNALSKYFKVYSNDGNGWYSQEFSKGKLKTKVVKDFPKKYKHYIGKTGTVIEYIADDNIFTETTKLNIRLLKKELNDIQYLCAGLRIELLIDDNKTEYHSEQGLVELVKRETIYGKPFAYKSDNMEVALNWTSEEGTTISSYVNISNTSEGGTHLDGLRKAILKAIREYTKEKVEVDDLLEGLVGAIHCKVVEPVYKGQTKTELTNVDVLKDVVSQLEKPLAKYFKHQPELTKRIINYAEKMLVNRSKLKDSKDLLKGVDKLTKSIKTIPDKFVDANRRKYKNPQDLELFIVEGDSAGGHFTKARDDFQGCLKVRGKMINAVKNDANKVIGTAKGGGNKEIRDLITILGCGILSNYDESKLRFGKVVLLADADIDGQHIVNLALSFLVTYMPELVKNGHCYIIDAPLFIGSSPNYRAFGKTRKEVETEMKKHKVSKFETIRLKGWGEVSEQQLSELCLDPAKRKLIQLQWSDDAESMMNNVMGNDVAFRKELLGVN